MCKNNGYHLTEHEKEQFFTVNPAEPDYIQAHQFSAHHREMLEQSTVCGCFLCLKIFNPTEIREWLTSEKGHTAFCPHCGMDTVIGDSSGYPITKEFLYKMKSYWFWG